MGLYKRGKIWWIKFQYRGEVIRRSAETTSRSKAREFEKYLREEVKRQYRGGKPRITFDQLMLRFLDEHLPTLKPKAAQRYIVSARALQKHFSGKFVDEITRGTVADFVSARKRDGVSTATIRRDLACGSIAFSLANDWEWADRNPFRDYRKRTLPEATPRTRVLTEAEREAILAADKVAPNIIKACWLTGMRIGELCALERKDVDFERGEILVRDSKNRRPRIVPLDEEGLAHFRAQKFSTSVKWMFWWGPGKPYTVEQVSRAFNRAAKRAGVKDARLHDTRHTFASDRISRGMDLYTLGKILGHSTPNQTAKYAHLQVQAMKEAMARTSRLVDTKTGTVITDFSADVGKDE